jgi:glycosyltransferase involved in cell wall biosynthesis
LLECAHACLADGASLLAFHSMQIARAEFALARAGFAGTHSQTVKSLRRQQHPSVLPEQVRARNVTAAFKSNAERERVSIIVPVFNEAASFRRTMEAVLAKPIPGADREIIVVESHSTDGTDELVLEYGDHPDVMVIRQPVPKGKGNAVREGIRHARGTIVLIQDADSEYDVNDYDRLLAPVQQRQHQFVLGSRHTGNGAIRVFNDQPGVASVFNFGHTFFLGLFNVLYGTHLTDPFTMYKVFRRDCLWGLKLECDRFDFDFELVIKLLRKGYTPIEIPVSYKARSFKQGKKVSFFRDPLTWIRALLKYRFVDIYA